MTTEHPITLILDILTPLIEDERDQILGTLSPKSKLIYTDIMTAIKYDIKWFGIRNKKEFLIILQRLTYSKNIAVGGEIIQDDENPTVGFTILNRLAQNLYIRTPQVTWENAIALFVDKVICMYNNVNDSLGLTELQNNHSALNGTEYLTQSVKNDYTSEDLITLMEPELIESILKENPILATIAFISLLPGEVLFFKTQPSITQGIDL